MSVCDVAIQGNFQIISIFCDIPIAETRTYSVLDTTIRERIFRTLDAAGARCFEHVSVSVSHGWVTLAGTVRESADIAEAATLAKQTVCICGVTNNIVVAVPRLLQALHA